MRTIVQSRTSRCTVGNFWKWGHRSIVGEDDATLAGENVLYGPERKWVSREGGPREWYVYEKRPRRNDWPKIHASYS